MKNNNQHPLNWKWALPTDKGRKVHSASLIVLDVIAGLLSNSLLSSV